MRRFRIVFAALMFTAITLQFLDFYHKLPKPYYMYNPTGTQFMPSLLEMLATTSIAAGAAFITFTILALICGRAYCSFFCPFGILMDIIARIKKLVRPSKKKIGNFSYKPARNVLRYFFLSLAIVFIAAGYTSFLGFIDPYSLYGKIMGGFFHPIFGYTLNESSAVLYQYGIYSIPPIDGTPAIALAAFGASLLILIAISAAAILRGRIYCNTICPVGAFLSIFARFSVFKISFDKSKCINCKICESNCKAECISVKDKSVDFSKCVLCFNCAAACPRNAIGLKLNDAIFKTKKSDTAVKSDVANKLIDNTASQKSSASLSRRSFPKLALVLGGLLCSAANKDAEVGKGLGKGMCKHNGSGAGKGTCQGDGKYNVSPDATPYTVKGDRPDKRLCLPPGSKSVENFLEHCTGCQICTAACKAQILKPSITEYGLSGFMQPFMDYSVGFCLYTCHSCTKACPTGAINFLSSKQKQKVKIGTAIFKKSLCVVNTDHTDCAACAEHCPVQAIEMLPFGKKEDSLYLPHVHDDVCIGCGACEYICPVTPHKAIVVQGLTIQKQAVEFNESMRLYVPQKKLPTQPANTQQEDFPF